MRSDGVGQADDGILERERLEQRAFDNLFRDDVAEKAGRAFAVIGAESVMGKCGFEQRDRIGPQQRGLRKRFCAAGNQAAAQTMADEMKPNFWITGLEIPDGL